MRTAHKRVARISPSLDKLDELSEQLKNDEFKKYPSHLKYSNPMSPDQRIRKTLRFLGDENSKAANSSS